MERETDTSGTREYWPMWHWRNVSSGVLALTLLGGVASCGIFASENSDVPSEKAIQVPLARGLTEERIALLSAKQEVIRRCMERQGFRYSPIQYPNEPIKPKVAKIFQGDDVSARRDDGYGAVSAVPEDMSGKIENPNLEFMNSLPAQQRRAYEQALMEAGKVKFTLNSPIGGKSSFTVGGCQKTAATKIHGNLKKWKQVTSVRNDLSTRVHTLVRNDPRTGKRMERWSACMAKKGYQYQTPMAAADAVFKKVGNSSQPKQELREWEIDVAVADAKCNRKVGLAKLLRQLRDKYAVQVKKKYEAQILTFLEMRAQALGRARETLNSQ